VTVPIRARLTFWYTAVLCVVLFGFGLGVVWVQQRFSRSELDSELEAIGNATASVLRAELGETRDLRRAAAETRKSIDVPGQTVVILDASGKPVAAHWRGFHEEMLPPVATAAAFETRREGPQTWRMRITRGASGGLHYAIVTAASTDRIARERRLLARALLVATPFALVFAACVCWWTASRALSPVSIMAEEAEAITAQTPEARLSSAEGADDELGQLAHAFNGMVQRLGRALHTQRRFMADASHELRTPVSIARTAAEVTLDRPEREECEYRDALEIVCDQMQRLGAIIGDMLTLARADAGGYPLRPDSVCLNDLIADVVRSMAVLADRRRVYLDLVLEDDAVTTGDDKLLRQLITNVIDNAIKHAGFAQTVRVSLGTTFDTAVIVVADNGQGVPPAERERIFERFVRLDPARDSGAGAGLGLPIARWIAEVHGGTIVLDGDQSQGARFVIRLPLLEPAASAAHGGRVNAVAAT